MKRSAPQATLFSFGFGSKDNAPPPKKVPPVPTTLDDGEESLSVWTEAVDEEDGEESLSIQTESVDEEDGPDASVSISVGNRSQVTMQTPSSSVPPIPLTPASFADLCPPYDIGEVIQIVQGLTDLEKYVNLPCLFSVFDLNRY